MLNSTHHADYVDCGTATAASDRDAGLDAGSDAGRTGAGRAGADRAGAGRTGADQAGVADDSAAGGFADDGSADAADSEEIHEIKIWTSYILFPRLTLQVYSTNSPAICLVTNIRI